MFGFKDDMKIKATDVLTGAIFGLLGFLFGTLSDFLNIKQEYEQFEHDKKIDHANRMLREADIVAKLTDDLLGENRKRQMIAVETIKVAVPTLGGSLLPLVVVENVEDEVSELASNALSDQRVGLANGLFDPQKSNRENAFFSISEGWNSDPAIVTALLDTVEKYDGPDRWPILNGERNEWLFETGVLNTFNVLGRFEKDALTEHKLEICKTADAQKANGKQTRTAAEYVEGLMGGC